jgi:hypothetical protein
MIFRRAETIERLRNLANLSRKFESIFRDNARHDSLPGQSKARQNPLNGWSVAENLNVFPCFGQICVRHLRGARCTIGPHF